MHRPFALAATLALTLSATAQAPEYWRNDCNAPDGHGQTYQQALDAILTDSAADPRLTPAQQEEVRAARGEFDSLCRVDDETHTHEARAFVAEEQARLGRFAAALEAIAKH
jgi:hypothetical protein